MTMEIAAPPTVGDRRRYKAIMQQVVEADGDWLRISLDEIAPGWSVKVKQCRWQAARTRGVEVQNTAQECAISVHLLKEEL